MHENRTLKPPTVPFYWPEISSEGKKPSRKSLATLPDGGFDAILSRGVLQAQARGDLIFSDPLAHHQELDLPTRHRMEEPNALSALCVSVRPDRRDLGLAVIIMEAMKTLARQEGLQLLVVPLRPTRKHEFPTSEMTDYIKWTLGPGRSPITTNQEAGRVGQAFDSWLRKHLRLGGRIVKVAASSYCVHATADEWQEWTGVDLNASTEGGENTSDGQIRENSDDSNIKIPWGPRALALPQTRAGCMVH
ncbi:MAG: hypothetical protein Q9199_007422 [Rusavskia elegans]